LCFKFGRWICNPCSREIAAAWLKEYGKPDQPGECGNCDRAAEYAFLQAGRLCGGCYQSIVRAALQKGVGKKNVKVVRIDGAPTTVKRLLKLLRKEGRPVMLDEIAEQIDTKRETLDRTIRRYRRLFVVEGKYLRFRS